MHSARNGSRTEARAPTTGARLHALAWQRNRAQSGAIRTAARHHCYTKAFSRTLATAACPGSGSAPQERVTLPSPRTTREPPRSVRSDLQPTKPVQMEAEHRQSTLGKRVECTAHKERMRNGTATQRVRPDALHTPRSTSLQCTRRHGHARMAPTAPHKERQSAHPFRVALPFGTRSTLLPMPSHSSTRARTDSGPATCAYHRSRRALSRASQ